jgi:isopenicillin-N epimerase
MRSYRELFLLDPEVVYLNHGSFGACPRPVFEAYQDWQRQLERQPVEFLGRGFTSLMGEARGKLASYLGVQAHEVIYFPNPTTALNMVARNLEPLVMAFSGKPLREGDEILTTDHEYGALDRTWQYTCSRLGLHYIRRPVSLPLSDPEELVDHLFSGVNERTRLIYLSHITSPTALVLPVTEIIRRAKNAGLLTIVDGAHAPGQVAVNLKEIGADIYAGACHKWLMAPKGSGFLFAREELQEFLDPLVISWGYRPEAGYGSGQRFVDLHEWQGTRDIAAFLAVSAAIDFQSAYQWENVRQDCHALAVYTRQQINTLTGFEPICREQDFRQMFTVTLPDEIDARRFQQRLFSEFRVEAPVISWNGRTLLRISIQGYNQESDIERLLTALDFLLAGSQG